MDKITHEVRMAQWKSIIAECLPRPAGQSTKQWLAEKGIHEKTYYYWQRKIRQEAYALIKQGAAPPAMPAPDTQLVTFAEIPYTATPDNLQLFTSSVVIRKGQTMLELSNTISDRLLDRLMEVVDHA